MDNRNGVRRKSVYRTGLTLTVTVLLVTATFGVFVNFGGVSPVGEASAASDGSYTGTSHDISTEANKTYSIATDSNGNYWVLDKPDQVVRKYNSSWSFTGTSFAVNKYAYPQAIELADDGNFYVGYANNGVVEYNSTGSATGSEWDITTEVSSVMDIEQRADGKFYALDGDDASSNNVYLYNNDWSYTSTAHPVSKSTLTSMGKTPGDTWYIGNDSHMFEMDSSFNVANSIDQSSESSSLYTLEYDSGVWLRGDRSTNIIYEYNSDYSPAKVSGQVKTTEGVPVSNATVEVVGVDYANLSGSPSEKREQAKEYARFAEKVKPTSYQQTTQPQDLLTSKQYVAVHPARAWGMNSEIKSTDDAIQNIAGNPKLGFASNEPGPYGGAATAEPGQLLTLTVWDTKDAGFIQDGVSRDLPGGIDDDTKIVVEKLGPGPDAVTDREVYDTDRSYDVVGVGGEHDFAYARLSEGFYRVYPENNSEVAYVVAVGNPDDIAAAYRDDLKDKSNSLTKQAKEISNFYENNTFRKVTVSTNETGHYNASLPSSTVNLTTVRAYKLPADANVDPKNATMQDARNYYEGVDINNSTSVPSIYLPGETKTVTPPKSGVTVTVREAPQSLFGLDIAKSEDRLDALAEYFFGKSFSELSSVLQEDIQNLDRERLEALYEEYADRATVSDDYRDRANANYDGAGDVIVDVNNSTSAELRERMTALEDANNELRETIEGSSEIGDTTNNSVSVGFDFGEDLTSEQVTVLARYSNGTTRVVNDSYLTFDDGPFGAGSTTVRVVDYPLGDTDPAQVSFRADVVTPDGGHGSETINVRNPTYSGNVPKLDAIALSSLQPGANDRVNVSLKPESQSDFGQLVGVDVTGPNGNAIQTDNISGRSTSFTTNGKGEYLVRATYTDANGNNFVATTRLEALDTDLSRPAGIRAKHSPIGMYAVAGDGFQSGDVERARGGARLTISGQVPANGDPPPSYHVYADGIDQPPEATTCTRVTRGSSEEVVRQRMGANVHVKKLPDDALVWRFDESGTAQPVTKDGSTSTYETSENGTTVSTFTNADGSVCIKTDTDVSRWERAVFEFRQIGIPFLSMTVVDTVSSPIVNSVANVQVAG